MDRRVRKTRKAIKDAFLFLSTTQDVNKIKVSKLTEIADINRKTFYLHYVDIFGVLEEIQNEFIHQANLLVSDMAILDPLNNVNASKILFDKLVLASTDFKTILNTEVYQSIINKSKEHFRRLLIKEYIDQGGKNIEFFSYVFTFYSSGILDVFKDWFEHHEKVSKEEVINLIDNLLKDALALIDIH